jgi:hypothetical protein
MLATSTAQRPGSVDTRITPGRPQLPAAAKVTDSIGVGHRWTIGVALVTQSEAKPTTTAQAAHASRRVSIRPG